MKGAAALPPELAAPDDRLALTMFIAAAFHAMVILGITFAPEDRARDDETPTLEVTVVRNRSEPPEDPDYLAQQDQQGAGNTTEKVRQQEELQQQAPPPAAQEQPPTPPKNEILVQQQADRQLPKPAEAAPEKKALPNSAELMDRSLEMLALNEQLRQSRLAYAQRPREKFISANTAEFKYANYMNDWVRKIERIGELNYPDEARRQGLSGQLRVDVALNADGTVRNITITKPSGHAVLDDAARRIVELAAPFPPFPPEIRAEVDVLRIKRTWVFTSSNQLETHRY